MQHTAKLTRFARYTALTEVVEIGNKIVHLLRLVWVRKLLLDVDKEYVPKIEVSALYYLVSLNSNPQLVFQPTAIQFSASTSRSSISGAKMELADQRCLTISRILIQAHASNTLDARSLNLTNVLLVNVYRAKVTV